MSAVATRSCASAISPRMYRKHLRQAGRVAGDEAALDELVRIALHEQAVLVGAGLALVAVDHEVARELAGGHEAPLGAGGEAGAAATEHRGGLAPRRAPRRACGASAGLQAVVAAGGEVALERVAVLVLEAGGDDLRAIAVVDVARRPRGRCSRRGLRRGIQAGATGASGARDAGGPVGGDVLAHARQRAVRRDLAVEAAGARGRR